VTSFISLGDIKKLSQVNRQLAYRMRVIMSGNFRFVVPGSLRDFRALVWTKACQNIRLTRSNSVFELEKDDVYVDITLPNKFDRSLEEVTWPSRLTHLTFGNIFNQPVDRLPVFLTHLTFGYDFNQPVDRLPVSLTHLTLGYSFNQSVDRLPASLTHLTFGWKFNQSVDRLPAPLTHLEFLGYFNQPVNHLPASLTHLTFGGYFNQPVDRLPMFLTHLAFEGCFNQPVDCLQEFLKEVVVADRSQIQLFGTKYRHLIKLWYQKNNK
jgi:hypothetical protein